MAVDHVGMLLTRLPRYAPPAPTCRGSQVPRQQDEGEIGTKHESTNKRMIHYSRIMIIGEEQS